MTDETATAEAQRTPETWIPLLIAVCVCGFSQVILYLFAAPFVLNLSFWGVGGVPGRFVTGITLAAVIGIFAWAIVWFGFVARTRRNLMDRYFLIIMGSSMAVGALLAALLVLPDLAARNALRQVALERRQIAAEDLAFEGALGRIMGGGVLKPGARPADLAADRARLAEGLRLIDSYRQRQMPRLAKGPNTALRASLRLDVGDYWTDWAAELQENDGELVDLGKARGSWQVTSRGARFSARPDLAAYDAHQLRLQKIGRDLQRVRTALLSGATPSD